MLHARVDDGTLETFQGPAQRPDATMTITEDRLAAVTGRGQTLSGAITAGAATTTGDPEALRRLPGRLRLPPRSDRAGPDPRAPAPAR
ncbi:alkyl sulfatase C-terminal domain-containing protein [Streptomyces sp. NPDC047141]|uniref:alkyl sulfatase C-terminal domain-containing protein n=1 Tax=Streptomyces sp. NPDC047141 TaxID=3155738 RepID=UPI0033CAA631